MHTQNNNLLELLNDRKAWTFPAYRKPTDNDVNNRAAAKTLAEVENADPFAYARTMLHLQQGYLLASDVLRDAKSRLAVRAFAKSAFTAMLLAMFFVVVPAFAQIGVHSHDDKFGPFLEGWFAPDKPSHRCCFKDCYVTLVRYEAGVLFAWIKEFDDFRPVPLPKIEQNRDNPTGENIICTEDGSTTVYHNNTKLGDVICFILGGGV